MWIITQSDENMINVKKCSLICHFLSFLDMDLRILLASCLVALAYSKSIGRIFELYLQVSKV